MSTNYVRCFTLAIAGINLLQHRFRSSNDVFSNEMQRQIFRFTFFRKLVPLAALSGRRKIEKMIKSEKRPT